MKDTAVIYRLPFSGKLETINGEYDAFAIAKLKPQPSNGTDKTVAVARY